MAHLQQCTRSSKALVLLPLTPAAVMHHVSNNVGSPEQMAQQDALCKTKCKLQVFHVCEACYC
eukprot:18725-Heterococcus_DN1.PRE.1